jgi:2-oxoglutarate ferredoxin oxidoreductase subunit beta
VLSALEHALADHGRPPHEVVFISGIGCSSRLPAYTSCYGFHGVHGRALPFATGVKLARPDLEVIAVGGDGDGYSIGGNHFVHACRRNLNMLYLVMDNRVYGMTKGQPSPTTEADWDSDIAPGGLGVRPLDPMALAIAAGATFVARGFAGRSHELSSMILEGLRWPGFAYIEVLSPCMAFRSEEFGWKEQVHPAIPRSKAIAPPLTPRLPPAMALASAFSSGILSLQDLLRGQEHSRSRKSRRNSAFASRRGLSQGFGQDDKYDN